MQPKKAKAILRVVEDVLSPFCSKWLWVPIFFMVCMMFSLYLGLMLGYYGFFIPYFWVFYLFIKELIRRLKRMPSEAWETPETRFKTLMEDADKQRAKTKDF